MGRMTPDTEQALASEIEWLANAFSECHLPKNTVLHITLESRGQDGQPARIGYRVGHNASPGELLDECSGLDEAIKILKGIK